MAEMATMAATSGPVFRDQEFIYGLFENITPGLNDITDFLNVYFIQAHGRLPCSGGSSLSVEIPYFTRENNPPSAYIQIGGGEFAGCYLFSERAKEIKEHFNSDLFNTFGQLLSVRNTSEIIRHTNFAVSGKYSPETTIYYKTGKGPGLESFSNGYELIPDRFLYNDESDENRGVLKLTKPSLKLSIMITLTSFLI